MNFWDNQYPAIPYLSFRSYEKPITSNQEAETKKLN
jgi:hypothetical protein